ncbi:hypothetical protein ACT691_06240 [Vibrio metschnikovii]
MKGSGRKSRILKEDVQNYVKEALKRLESGSAAVASGKGDGAALGLLPWPERTLASLVKLKFNHLSRIKKISGANLHRNVRSHVTQWDNADITELRISVKSKTLLKRRKTLA